MTDQTDRQIFSDTAALHRAAAQYISERAAASIAAHGRFTLVLAGGSTPAGVYRLLADEPHRSQIAWKQVYLFWSDERYLAHDDAASNYRMVREHLLDHVPLHPDHIYPIPTDYSNAQAAATAYHQQLQAVLAAGTNRFDLVLLGMGSDGHTASLFPHNAALNAPPDQLVVAVDNAPKPPAQRISLTISALNRAARVLFLVTGGDKASAVQTVLHGSYNPQQTPAQFVRPREHPPVWMLDQAAAVHLETT